MHDRQTNSSLLMTSELDTTTMISPSIIYNYCKSGIAEIFQYGSCGVFHLGIYIIVVRVFRDNSNDLRDLYKRT